MLRGPRFARASYALFAVVFLAALLKLGGIPGVKPYILRMVPTTPLAKATELADRGDLESEPLDLPKTRVSTFTKRLVTGLVARSDEEGADAPVFHHPSPGSARRADGGSDEQVCDDLGGFPKSSEAIFPLSKDYFGSYGRCTRIRGRILKEVVPF